MLRDDIVPLKNGKAKTFSERLQKIKDDANYPLNHIEHPSFFEDSIDFVFMNEPLIIDRGGHAIDVSQLEKYKRGDDYFNPCVNDNKTQIIFVPSDFAREQNEKLCNEYKIKLEQIKDEKEKSLIIKFLQETQDLIIIDKTQKELLVHMETFVAQHEQMHERWQILQTWEKELQKDLLKLDEDHDANLQNLECELKKLQEELRPDVSDQEIEKILSEQRQLQTNQYKDAVFNIKKQYTAIITSIKEKLCDDVFSFIQMTYCAILTTPQLTHNEDEIRSEKRELTFDEANDVKNVLTGPVQFYQKLTTELGNSVEKSLPKILPKIISDNIVSIYSDDKKNPSGFLKSAALALKGVGIFATSNQKPPQVLDCFGRYTP